jgi:hypothetical protein
MNTYKRRVIAAGGYIEGEQCAIDKINGNNILKEASWRLIPEGIEEDIVFAQKPTNGLGDLTFTRASDATRTNSAGVIERTPWNLLQMSEMFADVYWSKAGISVTANTTISPIGTLTADTVVEDSVAATQHRLIRFALPLVSGASYTVSAYVKRGTGTRNAQIGFSGAASWLRVYFDLSNGTVGSQVVGTGTITNVGGGWYRITATGTCDLTGNNTLFLANTNGTTSGSETYTGDGVSSVIWWGAQMVEGTDAKPYFATTNRQDVPRLDYRNADGSLNSCPRLLLEPQRTNSIRNSTMVGAVAGSPGTLPTNWGEVTRGLTRSVVGVGVVNGLQYIDVRYNGIATGTQDLGLDGLSAPIVAALGQTWSFSTYISLQSGTIPTTNLRQIERTAAGVFLTDGNQAISLTSTLQRFTYTRATTNALVERISPLISINTIAATAYDFTIRIAAPQMELGAYATTFIPTTTAAVTRVADAASKTGVSSLIGQNSGTLFVEWDNSDRGLINLLETYNNASGLTGTSTILIQKSLANQLNIRVFDSLGNYSDNFTATMPNGTNKLALAYQPGSAVYYLNGTFVGGNTRTYVFGSTRDAVGLDGRAPYPRAQAALFPTRLTNAQLAEITTL